MDTRAMCKYVDEVIAISQETTITQDQLAEELEYIEGISRGLDNYMPVFKFLKAFPSLINVCIGVDEFKDFTLLYNAVDFQKYDVLKKLLELGANPNTICEYIPLARAVEDEWLEGIKLLLKYGANPNIADEFGTTPIKIARDKGSQEISSLLLASKSKTTPQV